MSLADTFLFPQKPPVLQRFILNFIFDNANLVKGWIVRDHKSHTYIE